MKKLLKKPSKGQKTLQPPSSNSQPSRSATPTENEHFNLRPPSTQAPPSSAQSPLHQGLLSPRSQSQVPLKIEVIPKSTMQMTHGTPRSHATPRSQKSNGPAKRQGIMRARERAMEAQEKKMQEELVEVMQKVNESVDESARAFREALHESYLKQAMTDVTVQVGHTVFSCHGLILASAMSYFDKRIRVENSSYIRIDNRAVTGKIFKFLLQFIYQGRFTKDVSSIIEDLTRAIKFLGFTPQFQKMYGLALSLMDSDRNLKHWGLMARANLPEASDALFKTVLKDFRKLKPTDDDFEALQCQQVVDLLNNDGLQVAHEEIACDFGLLWMSHKNCTEDEAALVFQAMRLSQITLTHFENYVEKSQYVDDYPICKRIVEEARHYHDQPGRRHDYYDKRYHFRSDSRHTETMVLFGGIKKDGSRGEMMLAFNFDTHAWCSMGATPVDFGQDFAYCTFGNDIYVSGGTNKPKLVVRYSATKGHWGKAKDLTVGRSGHCMEVVDQNIYVLGGVDETGNIVSEVEEMNVETGVWRTVNKMIFPLTNACSAVIEDKVYTFGGILDPRSKSTTGFMQCFDPRKAHVTLIKDKAMVLDRPNAIKLNKTVYVINSDGRIYKVTEDHLTVSEVGPITSFNRKKFGLYHHHGKLLVVGGETDGEPCGDMVCFQPSTNQSILCPWSDLMPPVRSHFGVVKIVVEKSLLKEELNVKAL